MLQPAARILLSILFLVLPCAGTIVRAQDDLVSRGIETFRQTCLMADVRSEKIYQWATDRDLKLIQGPGVGRGDKILRWEVASSGPATVVLQLIIIGPESLSCSVDFDLQRDANKRAEAFFLEEMKRHPDAERQYPGVYDPDRSAYAFIDGGRYYSYFDGRQGQDDRPHILLAVLGTVAAPDVAVPRTFATPERTYRSFVNACLAHFPDIEGIADYAKASGWQSAAEVQTTPFYHSMWVLNDPFGEMSSYLLDLIRGSEFKSCKLVFDLRGEVPMERLIRRYALVHADYPTPAGQPGEKIEYYSGAVGGTQALFSVRTDEGTHSGELSVFVETPQ